MNKSYQETLDLLYSLQSNAAAMSHWIQERRTNKNTNRLDLMKESLQIIGVDPDSLSVIHIAGTKGKGSTSAFVERILREGGCHTGLFTSPHLVTPQERIRLNGLPISEEKFVETFWHVHNSLTNAHFALGSSGQPTLPFFYFLTLMGLKAFQDARVDVAVIEVGIGGRSDATNVFSRPVVTCVTSLDYDHMNVLGNTLAEIAWEKAGIFKSGVAAFTMEQPEEAMDVLFKEASRVKTNLTVVPPLDLATLGGRSLGIEGSHQLRNASVAVRLASEWFRSQGSPLVLSSAYDLSSSSPDPLPSPYAEGLSRTVWPGRSQRATSPLLENVEFFLDGAHTPLSMEASAQWMVDVTSRLTETEGGFVSVLCFGCNSGRSADVLLRPLAGALDSLSISHVVFTNVSLFGTETSGKLATETDVGHVAQMELAWKGIRSSFSSSSSSSSSSSASSSSDSSDGSPSHIRESIHRSQTVSDAAEYIRSIRMKYPPSVSIRVYVTGSLYVVGGVLNLFQIQS